MRRDLEGCERVRGANHADALIAVSNLGMLLMAQDKLKEAEPFIRRDLEGSERTLGRDHPSTLTAVSNMGALLQKLGKLKEAEPFVLRSLEGCERGFTDPITPTRSSRSTTWAGCWKIWISSSSQSRFFDALSRRLGGLWEAIILLLAIRWEDWISF